MSSVVTVEFDTENEKDIPKVGHRKTVRVNGKPESLYVAAVSVEMTRVEVYDEGTGKYMGIRIDYSGEAKLMPYDYIRFISESNAN